MFYGGEDSFSAKRAKINCVVTLMIKVLECRNLFSEGDFFREWHCSSHHLAFKGAMRPLTGCVAVVSDLGFAGNTCCK